MSNQESDPKADGGLAALIAWREERQRDPQPEQDPLVRMAVMDVPVLDDAQVRAGIQAVIGRPGQSRFGRLLRALQSPLGTGLTAAAVAVLVVTLAPGQGPSGPTVEVDPLAELTYTARTESRVLGSSSATIELFSYDPLEVHLEPSPALPEQTGTLEFRIVARSVDHDYSVMSSARSTPHKYGAVHIEEIISDLFILPPGQWEVSYFLGPPGSCAMPLAPSCQPRETDRIVIKPESSTRRVR